MLEEQTNTSAIAKATCRPALLVDRPGMRNYSTCLRHLFVGLAEMSYPSALICTPEANADSVLCPSVELIRYPTFNMPLLYAQNRKILIDRLIRFKPTVLHSFCPEKFHLTRYIASQLEIPFVLTFNTTPRRRFCSVVSDSNCSSLVASSKIIAQDLTRKYRRFDGRIHQINMGTFVEDTCACFSNPDRIPSMIVAQNINNPDHFFPLLNAVKHLTIDGYEFILAIIGSGPGVRPLHRQIKLLGLSGIVTLVSKMQPIRSIFSQADIFIQPQMVTEFNSLMLEAMSVGMAVATTRQNEDDMIIEDETALLFDQHDEINVYSTLQKLLDQRQFAKQIAIGAQTYLRRNHSVSKMTSALVEAYDIAQEGYKKSSG